MRLTSLLLLAVFTLSACDSGKDEPQQTASEKPAAATASSPSHQIQELQRTQSPCEGDRCASVAFSWPEFADQETLNQAVQAQLLSMVQGNHPDTPALGSLDEVAEQFLDDASQLPPGGHAAWQLQAEVQVHSQHADLLTLALNSYEFTGGAHGMPAQRFFHWDLSEQQPIALADMILDSQQDAFWSQARQAHQDWLELQQLDKDFRDSWPFEPTDNAYFKDDTLLLHYNVYSLAPYAMGTQTLSLPLKQLSGILRPEIEEKLR